MIPITTLDELVRTKSVIVCVGSGGVGKTTMSAAIALRAAEVGKRVCVLTIDPARRLASAMGLTALGNTESRIATERLEAAGVGPPSGQLWAMMLDTKRTWDDLVTRFAMDPEQARRILANHYYQQISSALAGSQEFMAMEKLYELHESGKYDVLVLDTPPTRHALDFLDAPKKMMDFMDEGVLKLFLTPGRLGFGFLRSSSALMFNVLERVTGFEVLRDISDFISSFGGMYAGFRDRATKVEEFLRADRTREITEDGELLFDLQHTEFRMEESQGRLLLHLWSPERNWVRRIVGLAEQDDAALVLHVERFGRARPGKLVVARPRRRRKQAGDRSSERRMFAAWLRRLLEREFPRSALEGLTTSPDLTRSFSGLYARARLRDHEFGRQRQELFYPGRILCGHRSDHRRRMATEACDGEDIGG